MSASEPALFLGVDGGGSKTAFVLIDSAGAVRGRAQAGSAYHLEVGLEGLAHMLADGVGAALRDAGAQAADVRHAFFGLPAHGEDSAIEPLLDALPAAILPAGRYHCGNDMVCGWAGSLGAADGINVVAGTGSIAYGEYGGRRARTGGWGEVFGDEGSAYWIAREMLTLFSRMSDGRTPRGALYTRVREHFGVASDLDVCAAINGPHGAARSGLAALARLASLAAGDGDAQAVQLFERAALALAELVAALRQTLGVPAGEELAVSYSGGVFSADQWVMAPFARELAWRAGPCRLHRPQLSPSLGAALYAARLCGAPLEPSALARLAHADGCVERLEAAG